MRYSSSTYLYSIIKSIGYSNIITYCSANLSSNSSTYPTTEIRHTIKKRIRALTRVELH